MALSFIKSLFSKNSSGTGNYSKGIASYNRAMSFYDRKQYNEVLKYLDDAINYGIDDAYAVRGLCLQLLEFYLDAVEDYNMAIKISPEDCNLYYCRGQCKHAVGDYAGAVLDGDLAVTFSKFENDNTKWKNEKAKEQGYKTLSNLYEMHIVMWKMDLEESSKKDSLINRMKDRLVDKNLKGDNRKYIFLNNQTENFPIRN